MKWVIFILVTLLGWVIGTIAVGMSEIYYITNSGVVDMSDVEELKSALSDPTFTLKMKIFGITVYGKLWPIALPITSGIAFGLLSLAVRKFIKTKKSF